MSDRKIAPVEIDGKTIWIEVEEIEVSSVESVELSEGGREHPSDLRPTATPTGAFDELKDKAASVGDTLEAIVGTIGRGIDKMSPHEWSVEVTIGFAGEKNIPFLAKGSVNGGVKVNAKWKKNTEER